MQPVQQSGTAEYDPASLNEQWFSSQSKAEFIEGAPHLKHPELRTYCRSLVQEVYAGLPKDHKPAVLDMGAGDGTLTVQFLGLGADVTAADVTVDFLACLKQRA